MPTTIEKYKQHRRLATKSKAHDNTLAFIGYTLLVSVLLMISLMVSYLANMNNSTTTLQDLLQKQSPIVP